MYRLDLELDDNNTNNPVESVNCKLKDFIPLKRSMSQCLHGLFGYLDFLESKMDYRNHIERY